MKNWGMNTNCKQLAEQLQYYRKRFIVCKIAWKKNTNQLCLCYIMVVLNFTFQVFFEHSELFSLSFTILLVHTTNRHCLGLHRSFVTKQLSIKLKNGKLACKDARGECRGSQIKTHKKPGREKDPISQWIFLMDSIIITKTMHSEIKNSRISIFIISKRSDQITAIKWAEYTKINQDRPVCVGGEENMLLAAYTNVWQKN